MALGKGFICLKLARISPAPLWLTLVLVRILVLTSDWKACLSYQLSHSATLDLFSKTLAKVTSIFPFAQLVKKAAS